MLKTRVITAVILLAILLAVLLSGSFPLFAAALILFFAAASWESFRLFKSPHPIAGAAVWTIAFAFLLFRHGPRELTVISTICVAIWVLRFVPSLRIGLPSTEGIANRLLTGIYGIAVLGCFLSMAGLFEHSALYLVSTLALVWIADIGAYFAGKAFGKRKLAPSISPGKSWEGAVGGWVAVMLLSGLSTQLPLLADTFASHVLAAWGWAGFMAVMTIVVAASIVGDLFESQLKRRAQMKDSSNLLPGHGGVLDRIDALIPVLPLAMLIDRWL